MGVGSRATRSIFSVGPEQPRARRAKTGKKRKPEKALVNAYDRGGIVGLFIFF